MPSGCDGAEGGVPSGCDGAEGGVPSGCDGAEGGARTDHHRVRICGVVLSDKDVYHERARRVEQPLLPVDEVEAKGARVAQHRQIGAQPGQVAARGAVRERRLSPERVGPGLRRPAQRGVHGLVGIEVVRQLSQKQR